MAIQQISERATALVRRALLDQGLTQEWLAEETGIPMRTLSRRLHKVNPSPWHLDELSAVATALGTDIVALLMQARGPKRVPMAVPA